MATQPNADNPWFGIPVDVSSKFTDVAQAKAYWANQGGGATVPTATAAPAAAPAVNVAPLVPNQTLPTLPIQNQPAAAPATGSMANLDQTLIDRVMGTAAGLKSNYNYINGVYKAFLGRDATQAELNKYFQKPTELVRTEIGGLATDPRVKDLFKKPTATTPLIPDIPTTPVNIEVPKKITSDSFSGDNNLATTAQDIQKLLEQNNTFREAILKQIEPSADERTIQSDLQKIREDANTLQQSFEEGVANIQDQPIPMSFITGQAASLERRFNLKLSKFQRDEANLLGRLGLAQDERKTNLAALEAGQGFLQQDIDTAFKVYDRVQANEDRVFERAQALSDEARQNFATIIEMLDGVGSDDLTPQMQAKLGDLAQKIGLPLGLVLEGLDAQKNKQLVDDRLGTKDYIDLSKDLIDSGLASNLQDAIGIISNIDAGGLGQVLIPPGTLAAKNNNPGNLRFVGQPGATQGEGGFAKFATPEAGYSALKNQIRLDQDRGLTLEKFINKYAPPSENNTAQYLSQMEKALGVPRGTPLSQISVDDLAAAVAMKESGTRFITPAQTLSSDQLRQRILSLPDATSRDGAFGAIASFKNAEDLNTLLGAGTDTGLLAGPTQSVLQKFGLSSPEYNQFKAAATAFTANYIKALSGVQVSDNERKFLLAALPSDSKTPEVNRDNMVSLLKFLQNRYELQLGIKFSDYPNDIPMTVINETSLGGLSDEQKELIFNQYTGSVAQNTPQRPKSTEGGVVGFWENLGSSVMDFLGL